MNIDFDPAYRYGELIGRESSDGSSTEADRVDNTAAAQRQNLIRVAVTARAEEAEQKQKFIELRAQGLSFDKIAKELHVSKPTLISWSRELAETIKNYKAIEQDALQEQYLISRKARVEILGGMVKLIKEELANRDLKEVPTPKLLELLLKYSVNLREDEKPLEFSEKPEIEGPFGRVTAEKEQRWSV